MVPEPELCAGVGLLPPTDRSGPWWPCVEGDVELGDLGAAPHLTVGVPGGDPRVVGDRGDRCVQRGGDTPADGELAVAGDESVDELADRASGVSPHQHRVDDCAGRVAGVVACTPLRWELGDGVIDHQQLVGAGVRGCVAGSEVPGEGFAGGVEEAEHRVEPEPALVVRCRSLLVLRVDLDERRVDVEHDLLGCATRSPHRGTRRRSRCPQGAEDAGVDLMDRSPDGRGGGDGTEQLGLVAQRRHVGDAAPASGEHHRYLGEKPASVLARGSFTGPGDRSRIARRQPGPICDLTEEVSSDHRSRVAVTDRHPNALHSATTVHLAGALLIRTLLASRTFTIPCHEGISADGPRSAHQDS